MDGYILIGQFDLTVQQMNNLSQLNGCVPNLRGVLYAEGNLWGNADSLSQDELTSIRAKILTI